MCVEQIANYDEHRAQVHLIEMTPDAVLRLTVVVRLTVPTKIAVSHRLFGLSFIYFPNDRLLEAFKRRGMVVTSWIFQPVQVNRR